LFTFIREHYLLYKEIPTIQYKAQPPLNKKNLKKFVGTKKSTIFALSFETYSFLNKKAYENKFTHYVRRPANDVWHDGYGRGHHLVRGLEQL
jgi:hypothetical protein